MEKQTVSGWWTEEAVAWVNQVWNWVKGEADSWVREREFLVYWSACCVEGELAGATDLAWLVWMGRGGGIKSG